MRTHNPGAVRRMACVSQAQRIQVSRRAGFQQHVGCQREPGSSVAAPSGVLTSSVTLRLLVLEVQPVQAAGGAGPAVDERPDFGAWGRRSAVPP